MAAFTHLIFRLLNAIELVPVPLCDWHHHGGSTGPDGLPDPHMDAFFAGLVVTVLCSIGILIFCSPFLAVRVRRIRDIFWVVPTINLSLYFATAALRVYPGGFPARFRPPGLWYTLAEVTLVLVFGLLVATVTAVVQWTVRKLKSLLARKNAEPGASPSSDSAAPPIIQASTEGRQR